MTQQTDTYLSIAAPGEGLYKELGSRFIARAWPVGTEAEAMTLVDAMRREYHDARHHCFAYRLGPDGAQWRASDDGEPSSSAGRPILGQIDSLGLSDVLVVVIRYFGGIKLGVPGLIRAYRTAARSALDSVPAVERVATRPYRISFDYLSTNEVMRTVKDMSLPVSDRQWGSDCSMDVMVRLTQTGAFEQRLAQISGCRFEVL